MANTTLNIQQLGNRFYDYRKDCWGNSYTWVEKRSLTQVQRLVIHHSVTQPTGNWKTETDFVGLLHKNRGWNGFGYHFTIGSDGVVVYVGDIGTARANVANHNEKVIGICLIGDFTKHLPTDIQINSAHDLCDFFINHYPALTQITGWDKVIGHKDALALWGNTTATACPGSSWPFDMRDRIRDNIVYIPHEDGTPVIETSPESPTEAPTEDSGGESGGETPDSPVSVSDTDSGGFPTGDGSDPSIPVESGPVDNSQPDTSDGTWDIPIEETSQETLQYSFISFLFKLLSKIPFIGRFFG